MTAIDRGPIVNQSPREANIDGTIHTTEDHATQCDCRGTCATCGAREHTTALHDGFDRLCESCPKDADAWMPAGTYNDDGTFRDA